jgi:hypothetical protein
MAPFFSVSVHRDEELNREARNKGLHFPLRLFAMGEFGSSMTCKDPDALSFAPSFCWNLGCDHRESGGFGERMTGWCSPGKWLASAETGIWGKAWLAAVLLLPASRSGSNHDLLVGRLITPCSHLLRDGLTAITMHDASSMAMGECEIVSEDPANAG